RMMVTGEPMTAAKLAGTLLVDRSVAAGDVVDAAVAFAGEILASGAKLRRLRDFEAKLDAPDAFFVSVRRDVKTLHLTFPAPHAIVDCVEAAVRVPFDEGIKVERAKFQELVNNEQSKELR